MMFSSKHYESYKNLISGLLLLDIVIELDTGFHYQNEHDDDTNWFLDV